MKFKAVIIILTLLFPFSLFSMPIVASSYYADHDKINIAGQSLKEYKYRLDLVKSNPPKSEPLFSSYLAIVKIDNGTEERLLATSIKIIYSNSNTGDRVKRNTENLEFEYDLTPYNRNLQSPLVSSTIYIPQFIEREIDSWRATIEIYTRDNSLSNSKILISQPVTIDAILMLELKNTNLNDFVKETYQLN